MRQSAIAALLCAAFLALGPALADCRAQQSATAETPRAPQKKESFRAWAKKNHLNYYLAGYAAVMAIAAGVSISGLSYRFSERSKLYSVAKARTTAWGAALGMGLGVAVAVMQVPSKQQGKLLSLIVCMTVATLATPLVTYISFAGFRRLHILRAGKRGRPTSVRMDLL
ncbi:MAG: hypothetical protein FGM15_09390 [Chthoniobacterales bacterium]|nr:hypothetical protein [Chthoniobacterales bacterium]